MSENPPSTVPGLTPGSTTDATLPASLASTTVAVLGGTGPQGRGLARRFAAAGVPVVLGSRSAERAQEAA
ncbi:MAG: reduced coenzyme oxidoreductase, partial [Marmoricola sp.]|nr:reduced coenzyme oxidoreductase [Marmoricola sp.]